jgi:hypothetical protein
MSAIKRHIIRVNVKGKGNSLYSGDSYNGFKEQPLGLASVNIPSIFLKAQKRLDSVLETRKLSWSLSFLQDNAQNQIVAYGCFLEKPEEDNRTGLFFIHAIELNDHKNLFSGVSSIINLLSNSGVRIISKAVEDVAIGKRDVYEFLTTISQKIENALSLITEDVICQNLGEIKFSKIEHDCAGAAATAWLIMAGKTMNSNPPWEVYDTVGSNGNILTVVSPSTNNSLALASEIQRQSLKYFLSPVPSVNLGSNVEPIKKDNLDKDVSNNIKPKDNNELVQKGNIWLKIGTISSLLSAIILVCSGIYFINNYNNQQKHFLDELNLIAEKLKQSSQLPPPSPEVKVEIKQPAEQELTQLIGKLFDENKTIRLTALSDLAKWKSDPRIVRLSLDHAQNYKSNETGVFYILRLLKQTDVELLKQNKETIMPFLEEVKTNGRPTQSEVTNIKKLLGEQ